MDRLRDLIDERLARQTHVVSAIGRRGSLTGADLLSGSSSNPTHEHGISSTANLVSVSAPEELADWRWMWSWASSSCTRRRYHTRCSQRMHLTPFSHLRAHTSCVSVRQSLCRHLWRGRPSASSRPWQTRFAAGRRQTLAFRKQCAHSGTSSQQQSPHAGSPRDPGALVLARRRSDAFSVDSWDSIPGRPHGSSGSGSALSHSSTTPSQLSSSAGNAIASSTTSPRNSTSSAATSTAAPTSSSERSAPRKVRCACPHQCDVFG